jgi:hypothetical protein
VPSSLNWTDGLGGTPVSAANLSKLMVAADAATAGTPTGDALRAALVLPKVGGYTYNADGTVASGPDGETYAYNSDGTVHSVTLNGTTRVYSYNTDGTVSGAA